jgi:uncharacterized protein (TIGR02268 family)
MRRSAVLAALALGLGAEKPSSHPAPPRRLERRTVAVTDASFHDVPVVHVAKGVPTTVSFGQTIRRESILLADTSDAFLPPRATDTTVVLIPIRDLAPRTVATLTVTLADGTLVPLLLETDARVTDIAVDVAVNLSRKSAPESVSGLKTTVLQLRGELDECRGDSGKAGVAKLARLVLEQDVSGNVPMLRQEVHRRDKQERLLVELLRAYRLFGHTYLLLTVENRDPSAAWVLDRPELSAAGGRESMEVPVLAFEVDVPVLQPNETGHLVLAFRSPLTASGERFQLRLLEKNGTRHVRVEGLSL